MSRRHVPAIIVVVVVVGVVVVVVVVVIVVVVGVVVGVVVATGGVPVAPRDGLRQLWHVGLEPGWCVVVV